MITLELIIFITSIVFGIFIYWRESRNNKSYRFLNRLLYSKDLQMKPEDKTGFVYQQKFILRLVYLSCLFLVFIVIARILIPIDLVTISLFISSIVGTLIGTYLASFILKSGEIIEDKTEAIEDIFTETIEKGKDFIEDLKTQDELTAIEEGSPKKEPIKDEPEKNARDRLKDKGLL